MDGMDLIFVVTRQTAARPDARATGFRDAPPSLVVDRRIRMCQGKDPADASLFRAVFFEPKTFFNQQLNSSGWSQSCDHSVTSADVRLSVGPKT
jgi:hypothetical protein